MPESAGKSDAQAVAVVSASDSGSQLRGFLPNDESIKLFMEQVADKLAAKTVKVALSWTTDESRKIA